MTDCLTAVFGIAVFRNSLSRKHLTGVQLLHHVADVALHDDWAPDST